MDENPNSGFSVTSFVNENNVRLTWIAFFSQWTLWGLVYFVRHVFGEENDKPAPAEQDTEAAAKKAKWKPEGAFGVSKFSFLSFHQ